ncbi:MAG TPA: SMP-30/gluconolactonase/LRE family protein [Acidimicrobiales bacterium]|nr:SMP-30/gluconolactonase/LRE family protein [Acidimicrobiales bacterium]
MRTTVHEPLSFEVLATGLGFPEGPVFLEDGSVLVVDIEGGKVLRVASDGSGVSVVASPGGGPNGLARTAATKAVIANNGGFLWTSVGGVSIPIDHTTHTNEPPGFEGGWIEEVDLTSGAIRRLYDGFDGRRLRGPNDLVVDEVGGLWFTDHGKGRMASVDRGGLYYAPAGGGDLVRIAFPLLGPNGVGLSPDGRTVYAAETHTGRLWAWDLREPGVVEPAAGSLAVRHGGRCIVATPFSFDSLAVEEDGRIAIGAIGDGIVVLTPDGEELDVYPIPGDVTTNIAFGGHDMRSAVITLSRSGRLVRCTWPRRGLRLVV